MQWPSCSGRKVSKPRIKERLYLSLVRPTLNAVILVPLERDSHPVMSALLYLGHPDLDLDAAISQSSDVVQHRFVAALSHACCPVHVRHCPQLQPLVQPLFLIPLLPCFLQICLIGISILTSLRLIEHETSLYSTSCTRRF
jgi:hypothetical protein